MERIHAQQKAATFSKSKQKGREEKAAAEASGEPVKKPEEKLGNTTERRVPGEETTRVNPPKELEPVASHSASVRSPRAPRNVRGSDSELSVERFDRMNQRHEACTNCCGGLPGRGPGTGRIGGGGQCCGSRKVNLSDYEGERLRGGGDNGESPREKSPERFRGGCGSGCFPPSPPCFQLPCAHPPRNSSCPPTPPTCWRSHRWQTTCQSQRIGMRGNTKPNCPCGSCGGPGCRDNPGRTSDSGCCSRGPAVGAPCKCKCQSCQSFQPQGGCGGQSCGKMYSCSGSGGGGSCFPRNYRRREDSGCCGGSSPQHRSGCC
ncbi:keratin-associated protein 5-10 isoform X2 [Fopius arisanus]|nr:PREDICTED: keratin-associated protein 5-10-like isoform X2 [Fopius arisanus]